MTTKKQVLKKYTGKGGCDGKGGIKDTISGFTGGIKDMLKSGIEGAKAGAKDAYDSNIAYDKSLGIDDPISKAQAGMKGVLGAAIGAARGVKNSSKKDVLKDAVKKVTPMPKDVAGANARFNTTTPKKNPQSVPPSTPAITKAVPFVGNAPQSKTPKVIPGKYDVLRKETLPVPVRERTYKQEGIGFKPGVKTIPDQKPASRFIPNQKPFKNTLPPIMTPKKKIMKKALV